MKHRSILTALAATLLTPILGSAQDTSPTPTDQNAHDARMEWFHEAKFGMFIHWGLYSIPGRGEKVMHRENYSVAKYAELAKEFNPVKFDAEEWVQFARDTGMKYMVITAKHHDGFAMYDSKVSDFNIVDATPFKRDPIKELADACAKAGIKFGVYYSEGQDWHHPGGGALRGPWDPVQKGSYDRYIHEIAIPQVEELMKNYKPAVLWFDAPGKFDPAIAREFVQTIRSVQPETLINSRLSYSGNRMIELDKAGLDLQREIGVDYLSYPDRGIPTTPAPSWETNWETCMTLNDTWGYTADDDDWKSPQTVVQMLARVVSKGGNFLLNFGPTAEGVLQPESMEIMKPVGEWLKANGESIYGAQPSDFGKFKEFPAVKKGKRMVTPDPEVDWLSTSRPADKATDQPAKLYLHIFKWPAGQLEVEGLTGKVSNAYLLADAKRTPLQFTQQDGTFSIELSGKAPDPLNTVVCLEYATGN